MHKLFVFVCVGLVFQPTSTKTQPRDLIDEVKEQLEELKSVVQSDILVAHNDLNNLGTNFHTYANNIAQEGKLAIEEKHSNIFAQIRTLANLAWSAGKDAARCVDVAESTLYNLPPQHIKVITSCVNKLLTESTILLRDTVYIIDVNINKILNLEDQLRRCGDRLTCIQPIATEIQLDMIRLPASIKTEVNAVESQLSSVELMIPQCSDVEVLAYSSTADKVFADTTYCINAVINSQ